MLPLILHHRYPYLVKSGKEGKHVFWIVGLLFFLTVLPLSTSIKHGQPRERDYAYAGSFYAYSIWIGLGVLRLIRLFKRFLPKNVAAVIVSIAALGVQL